MEDKGYILGDTILSVDNVNKSFDGRRILNNVSFSIKDVIRENCTTGQIVSLIGRSGIGKTVLFNILAGFLEAEEGDIILNDNKVTLGSVGVVPQNYILFSHYTIKKNLELALKKGKQDTDYMNNLIEKFELGEHLDKYPSQLSGGQRQRVSILQQILVGHNFLCLDEPFSGLDYPTIKKVTEVLVDVANLDEKNTLLIISHDIETALSISDKAFLLKKISDTEGATITDIYDLKSMGLAWNPNIQDNLAFQQLVSTVRHNL